MSNKGAPSFPSSFQSTWMTSARFRLSIHTLRFETATWFPPLPLLVWLMMMSRIKTMFPTTASTLKLFLFVGSTCPYFYKQDPRTFLLYCTRGKRLNADRANVQKLPAGIWKGCSFAFFTPPNRCREAQHPTWRIKRRVFQWSSVVGSRSLHTTGVLLRYFWGCVNALSHLYNFCCQ